MIATLLGLVALLLFIIALFLNIASGAGQLLGAFLTGLTMKMEPGVVHEPKRGFPVHVIFYLLSFAAGALSIYVGCR
jgi:hypothetical protein